MDSAPAGGPAVPSGIGEAGAGPLRAAVAAITRSHHVLLVLHVRPDGDSVGCSLAMARCLRALGKEATVVCADPVPPNLAFLDPDRECQAPAAARGPFDLALFLDCADPGRLGSAADLVRAIPCVVNIDHHPSNPAYGHINWIDSAAAACGELATALLDALGGTLDARMATALYAALATDTGGFRYDSTTPTTLSIAARLRAAGADVALIGREVWESRSLSALRLLAQALQSLEVGAGGELAWVSLNSEAFAERTVEPGDTEGLVDYPRSVRGVEVAALFVADRPGEVRVSLRSQRRVDVSTLATRFGGGGHARAAGCTLAGSLEDVRRRVLDAARAALAEGPRPVAGRGPDAPVAPDPPGGMT